MFVKVLKVLLNWINFLIGYLFFFLIEYLVIWIILCECFIFIIEFYLLFIEICSF